MIRRNGVQRFPRTDDKAMLYLCRIRAKYPAPPHNPHAEGPYNPADSVLSSLLKQDEKVLKKLCDKHALRTGGSRGKLIKRLYLHWRASKLVHFGKIVGSGTYIGYGKGYRSTRTPTCHCGSQRRDEYEKTREDKKAVRKAREEAKAKAAIRRFPRYPKGIMRFPRLA